VEVGPVILRYEFQTVQQSEGSRLSLASVRVFTIARTDATLEILYSWSPPVTILPSRHYSASLLRHYSMLIRGRNAACAGLRTPGVMLAVSTVSAALHIDPCVHAKGIIHRRLQDFVADLHGKQETHQRTEGMPVPSDIFRSLQTRITPLGATCQRRHMQYLTRQGSTCMMWPLYQEREFWVDCK
jgi:hypothetical protein